MLEKAGHLSALFTDSIASRGLGRWLGRLPSGCLPAPLQRLSSRLPHGVPPHKIRHTDRLLGRRLASLLTRPQGPYSEQQADLLFDRVAASWDFRGADTLYAMRKHGTRLLKRARAQGLRVVVDVFVTPLAGQIVAAERQRFPDLEPPAPPPDRSTEEDARTQREIEHADLLLCPGSNVAEGLAAYPASKGKAYAVVPYGCGTVFDGLHNTPVPGRVLFAGTADLRKGLPYLGMAATLLAGKGHAFRVAGAVTDTVRRHPLMRHLTFLGRLPRDRMQEEFLKADVMVLPTLAEGCASVVHEAVAAGCPVITTKAAGSLIQNHRGGLLVPERDPEALASAIEQVLTHRDLRQQLAHSCLELAQELTEDAWCQRLLTALQDPTPQVFGD